MKLSLLTSRICLFVGFFFYSFTLQAQQNAGDTLQTPGFTGWETGGSFALNFSQVKLSNWAGGGQSSVSIGSLVTLEADYATGESIWENQLDLMYGLIRQGEEDRFNKTDDLLNLLSKYNYHIDERYYITALADFRTQMGVGYEYSETGRERISDFMAPGFLVTSLGVTHMKPKRYSITLSPFAGKFTFVLDDQLSDAGAFGVEPGERIRKELGAALNSRYEKELLTNVKFRSSLNLFANYSTLSQIDVNWTGKLLLKVNRYINSTIAAQLVYDHDIIQKTQWRNVINVGFLLEI